MSFQNHQQHTSQEERMRQYREQREARQRQRQRELAKRRILLGAGLILCLALIFIVRIGFSHLNPSPDTMAEAAETESAQPQYIPVGAVQFRAGYTAEPTSSTITLDDSSVLSAQAILLDVSNNTIVAQKDAYRTICPASMTKILTILVAAEHITNLDDTFTITREITDYCYTNKCSAVGFSDGETVSVRDLFYGTILPSGADAAAALAIYTAGSQEEFMVLMNQKLEQLGLADTSHFTNCVGLYDELHYSTAYDMAMILKAALENDWCRQVLSARTYTTSITQQHPEGLLISNWFLRRIEDKETGGAVLSAKTGFVNQSGNCAASYFVSNSGTPYIAVTVNTYSSWRCIYDHVALYSGYTASSADSADTDTTEPTEPAA